MRSPLTPWQTCMPSCILLIAAALRVLLDSAAICRAKLLILFGINRRYWTLDLRIGIRIPTSQPFIWKDFLKTVRFLPSSLLRLWRGLLRTGYPTEFVHGRHICPWNQMPVGFQSNLNRAVPPSGLARRRARPRPESVSRVTDSAWHVCLMSLTTGFSSSDESLGCARSNLAPSRTDPASALSPPVGCDA